MTPERFAHLADAYGADLRRWPSAERDQAQTLIDSGNHQARDALTQARTLDGLLDSHRAMVADPALIRRVVASAPTFTPTSFWTRYAGWLSPAGFIGAGLAGVAAGMLVASLSLPLPASHENLPSFLDQNDAEMVMGTNGEENEQ